jgi:hypothetical protein
VFVGDEVLLTVGFAAARDRLAELAESGVLVSASQDAYRDEGARVVRVGAGGLSKLVRVEVRELARSDGFAIRWEATGPGGRLFPVLDADIRLASAGERAAWLTIAGSYRPPLGSFGGALDRAILHRVASVTIRSFLARVGAQIAVTPVR